MRLQHKLFQATNKGVAVYSAFPKSASQHILNLLTIGTNSQLEIISPKMSNGFGHNFINTKSIYGKLSNYFKNILIYGHIPYHEYNSAVIKNLTNQHRVLISIRPLPDVVVSYKEHVEKGGGFGPLDYRIPGLAECNPNWNNLSEHEKYDFIIQFIIPWYVRYIIGWLSAATEYKLKFITFEEHTLFPYEALVSVSEFLKIQIDKDKLSLELQNGSVEKSNFNVGKRGRGYQALNARQLSTINAMFSSFGGEIFGSNIVKYLLYGYDGLAFTPKDVINDNSILIRTFERIAS